MRRRSRGGGNLTRNVAPKPTACRAGLRAERDPPIIALIRRAAKTPVLCAVIAGASCAEIVSVDIPEPPPGSRAALIAIEHARGLAIDAIDLSQALDEPRLPYVDALEGDARVVALYYQRPLAELDLSAGPVERADPTFPDRRLLPTADQAFAARVRGDDIEGFTSISPFDLGGALATFEIERTAIHDCFPLAVEELRLGTTGGALALARFDDTRVAVAAGPPLFMGRSQVFLAGAGTGTVTRAAEVDGCYPISAYRIPGGDLWLGCHGGIMSRGELRPGTDQLTFVTDSVRDHGHGFAFLDGPRDASTPAEMFGLAPDGELDHWDPASGWRTIEKYSAGAPSFNFGGMLWLGPESVVLTPAYTRDVFWLERTEPSRATLPVSFGELRTIGQLSNGTVFGVSEPSFVVEVYPNGNHRKINEGLEIARSPRSVAPLAEGYVYLSAGGTIAHWQPNDGYCEAPELRVPGLPWRAIAHDGRVFVLFSDEDVFDDEDVEARLIVLTPVP